MKVYKIIGDTSPVIVTAYANVLKRKGCAPHRTLNHGTSAAFKEGCLRYSMPIDSRISKRGKWSLDGEYSLKKLSKNGVDYKYANGESIYMVTKGERDDTALVMFKPPVLKDGTPAKYEFSMGIEVLHKTKTLYDDGSVVDTPYIIMHDGDKILVHGDKPYLMVFTDNELKIGVVNKK